jgi:DNA-binding LytR/AlgR family response regulator
MNCIIIEDQPPAQRLLKKYIEDIGTLHLMGTFPDAIQAMDYLKSAPVDLVFLDIHLPKMSGIDWLKTVSDLPAVILTTAYSDYALESYEFRVVDYLLKPFSFQRFVKAVARVPTPGASELRPQGTEVPPSRREIFIKSGYEHIRIESEAILYIKSDADYTEIVLPQKKYLSAEPLRNWLDILDSGQFVRVHKSYIINTARIVKVSGNQIYMSNAAIVPIGRAFKDDFVDRFLNG